jgi:hypothetical protein
LTPKTNIGVSSLLGAEQDDLLRARGQMLAGGVLVEEEAGGFDDDIGADFVPLEAGRIAFLRQADALAIDHQRVAVHRDVALEAAMHRVVLQHVREVVGLEQVIDADDFDVAEILQCRAQARCARCGRSR